MLYNLVIEDKANFVQLLKVPNLCPWLLSVVGQKRERSTSIGSMLCVFYRVALQTCACPELGYLVPDQVKNDLFRLVDSETGNDKSLIMEAILAELSEEYENTSIGIGKVSNYLRNDAELDTHNRLELATQNYHSIVAQLRLILFEAG